MDEPDPIFPSLPATPAIFGRYRILRRLGMGGMGAVYLAEDTKYRSRPTAIKIQTNISGSVSAERFQREAEVSRVLDHPNICRVYDVGVIDNRPYMTMKLVAGADLTRRVGKGKRWAVDQALPLVIKLTEAYQYAHDHGVFHRDIKPANIMLAANDEPVVMDFGLAKVTGDATLTVAGAIFGTPHYMPLEQARGELKQIGPHSDVYSLAVILFQMLTGELPFVGDTPLNVITRIALDPVPPLRQFVPDADPQLEAVLRKAMAKPVKDRYPTMREFADALQSYQRPVTTFLPSVAEVTFPHSIPPPERYRTKCPRCNQAVRFALKSAGKPATCPKCKTDIILPSQDGGSALYAVPPKPALKAGETRDFPLPGGLTMTFCYIPPGTAQLGSPKAEQDAVAAQLNRREEWLDEESEAHSGVYQSKGFWMAKFPVTQAEWHTLMGTSPSHFRAGSGGASTVKGLDTLQFPVENVSWDMISGNDGFLEKMNKVPDVEKVFGHAGRFALPHEDMWEYACRGGQRNKQAFYWGNDLNGTQANVDGNYPFGTSSKGSYLQRPTPVGSFETRFPHPWGLCDLHGNVWEWCENMYEKTNYRALRGGSWKSAPINCRGAFRGKDDSLYQNHSIGFRLALLRN